MHQQNVTRNGFELFIFIELVDRLWKAARNAPQRRPPRQKGGRRSALTNPSMVRAVRNFLTKHSKETSPQLEQLGPATLQRANRPKLLFSGLWK